MAQERSDLEQLIEQLEQQRDELLLQLHMGKAEAKDEFVELEKKWEQLKADPEMFSGEVEATVQAEWAKLEQQWEELNAKEAPIRETVHEVSEDVGAAVQQVGDDLPQASCVLGVSQIEEHPIFLLSISALCASTELLQETP